MQPTQPVVRPERNLKQVSEPTRGLYPALVIGISAFLLLLVVRAELRGMIVSRALMGVVAVSFFAAILAGTFFLVRALREQKRTETQVVQHLAMAVAAQAEADALRKATQALTQDLRMDFVMEALLRSLEELIPYTCARVLVPEGGPHVLALGERQIPEPPKGSRKYRPGYPLTLVADESAFLERILEEKKSVLIRDTEQESGWQTFKAHRDLRSWLSVPLFASDTYLGFLSIGHTDPNRYNPDHLRRAELLSIPAAAAIQNARSYARAEVYVSELEKRLVDLHQAEKALAEAKGDPATAQDKFRNVFRAGPIPFSITSLQDGRFVDVNVAFEQRYGYQRAELLAHSVHELGLWCDPADRVFLIQQLSRGIPVRNAITRLRTKSGEVKLTAYSADRIHFEGQACILAVSGDLPEYGRKQAN